MSGGYTPLFSTMLEGTLHGRWPHTGVWACLLSMVDYRGEIDKHPRLIAGAIGIPLPELLTCISDFMAPDADSRSTENDGRRLELIDAKRDWGWRVVNIQKYRNRAAAMKQVADGRNAEKVQRYKQRHRRTPKDTEGHHGTLDSNSNSNSNSNKTKTPEAPAALDAVAWGKWVEYRKARKPAIKPMSLQAAMNAMAALGAEQASAVEHSIANGFQGLVVPRSQAPGGWREKPYRKPKSIEEIEAEERARAN